MSANCEHDMLEFWEVHEVHNRYEVRHDGNTAFAAPDLEGFDVMATREPATSQRRFFTCPQCGSDWDVREDEHGRWVRNGLAY
jgi:hypothetical protein